MREEFSSLIRGFLNVSLFFVLCLGAWTLILIIANLVIKAVEALT